MKVSIKPDGTIDFDNAETAQIIEVRQAMRLQDSKPMIAEHSLVDSESEPKKPEAKNINKEYNHEIVDDEVISIKGKGYVNPSSGRVFISPYTGKPIANETVYVRALNGLITIFCKNGNTPSTTTQLSDDLLKIEPKLKRTAVSAYMSAFVAMGIISKEKNGTPVKYFLSSAFINQFNESLFLPTQGN